MLDTSGNPTISSATTAIGKKVAQTRKLKPHPKATYAEIVRRNLAGLSHSVR